MKKIMKSILFSASAAALFCLVGCDLKDKEEKPIPMNPAAELKTAQELISWIKTQEKMTEIQRKKTFEELKGRMVIVVGEVREIGKTTFGDKTFVSLTVDKISRFEKANVQFNVPDSLASTVIEWQKGEKHVMRGRISETGDLTDDVVCDQAEVLDKSEELNKYLNSLNPEQSSQSKETSSSSLKDKASGLVSEKRRKQFGQLSAAAQNLMNDEQKAKLQELKDKAQSAVGSAVDEINKSMTDEDKAKLETLKEGASSAVELIREIKPQNTDND